jgi:hypothetical protein
MFSIFRSVMGLALASVALVQSVSALSNPLRGDVLYDGYVRYWDAKYDGQAGATRSVAVGPVDLEEGSSSGNMSYGVRIDTGRTLTDLIYSKFDLDSYAFAFPRGAGGAVDLANPANFMQMNRGDRVNMNMDRVDIQIRNPLVRNRDFVLRYLAGLTWLDVNQRFYSSRPGAAPGTLQYGELNREVVLPVAGLEAEFFLGYRLSLRAQYKNGFMGIGSSDDAQYSEYEAAVVYTPANSWEVELGYKALDIELTIREDHAAEHKIDTKAKGPFAQLNYLF